MGPLDGKVAVISGGTSGIGARTAELFVNEGAKVIIAGRRRERGEELAAKLRTAASFIRTDVSIEHDVAAMIKQAIDCFGRLDCLFNNAAEPSSGSSITDIDIQRFNAAIDVHVGGALLGMKHAAPIMMRQQSGSIMDFARCSEFGTAWRAAGCVKTFSVCSPVSSGSMNGQMSLKRSVG